MAPAIAIEECCRGAHPQLGQAVFVALAIGVAAWWDGWFAREPAYHARTVTGWLDHMALFDDIRSCDETGNNSFQARLSPRVVTNDCALRALIRLGPRAVPVLAERLSKPPTGDPRAAGIGVEKQTPATRCASQDQRIFSRTLA